MRITFGMTAQNSLRNIEANSQRMATTENQITSGSKLSKPSDDPIGVARALSFQQSIDQSSQYLKNIDQGTNWLNITDSTLGGVNDDVQRARELGVQAANGTMTPEDRQAISLEVTQLQQSVMDLSNSKIGSSYLFSGSNTSKPGYVLPVSSAVNPAAYQGNAAGITREISPGVVMSVNAAPQATFDPVFTALSALQAGLVNQATAPAISTPGVIAGSALPLSPSPAISASGSLTINGVSVAVTAGATAAATVATINATAGLGATGAVTASLDTNNRLVLTSNTVGADATVTVGGATPNSVYTDLGLNPATVAGLDNPGAIQVKLQASLTALDGALDAINTSRSGVGAKMNRLSTLQGQQESVNINLTGLLSQVKDVDMAQAITAYTTAQTVYTASLKSAAQSMQSSLLDYLH